MDNALIIESANFGFGLFGLYGIYRAGSWKLANHLSSGNVAIVRAWMMIFLSIAINVTYFALLRHWVHVDAFDHETGLSMRTVVVVGTMILFAIGMLEFIRGIDGISRTGQAKVFLGIVAVAFALGVA